MKGGVGEPRRCLITKNENKGQIFSSRVGCELIFRLDILSRLQLTVVLENTPSLSVRGRINKRGVNVRVVG